MEGTKLVLALYRVLRWMKLDFHDVDHGDVSASQTQSLTLGTFQQPDLLILIHESTVPHETPSACRFMLERLIDLMDGVRKDGKEKHPGPS